MRGGGDFSLQVLAGLAFAFKNYGDAAKCAGLNIQASGTTLHNQWRPLEIEDYRNYLNFRWHKEYAKIKTIPFNATNDERTNETSKLQCEEWVKQWNYILAVANYIEPGYRMQFPLPA